jgi:hypothetical protein
LTDWGEIKDDDSLKKTPHPRHLSIDRKHTFLCVKFEVKFIIILARKSMFNEKWFFSWGMMVHPFSRGGV